MLTVIMCYTGCKMTQKSEMSNTWGKVNTAYLSWPLKTTLHAILCLLLWEAWVCAIVPWPAVDPLDPDLLPLRGSEVRPASIGRTPSLPQVIHVMEMGQWGLYKWQTRSLVWWQAQVKYTTAFSFFPSNPEFFIS